MPRKVCKWGLAELNKYLRDNPTIDNPLKSKSSKVAKCHRNMIYLKPLTMERDTIHAQIKSRLHLQDRGFASVRFITQDNTLIGILWYVIPYIYKTPTYHPNCNRFISEVALISFTDSIHDITLDKVAMSILKEMRHLYSYIVWEVYSSSPAIRLYDTLIQQYGGDRHIDTKDSTVIIYRLPGKDTLPNYGKVESDTVK